MKQQNSDDIRTLSTLREEQNAFHSLKVGPYSSLVLTLMCEGGGQIKPCDAKNSEKCSHLNNNIPVDTALVMTNT